MTHKISATAESLRLGQVGFGEHEQPAATLRAPVVLEDIVANSLGAHPSATLATKQFNFGPVVLKSLDDSTELARVDRVYVSVTQVTNPDGTLRAWFVIDSASTSLGYYTKDQRPAWRWAFKNATGEEMIDAHIDTFEGYPDHPFHGYHLEPDWVADGAVAIHYLPTGPWFDRLQRLSYHISGTFYRNP
jgi:hypothetical protein